MKSANFYLLFLNRSNPSVSGSRKKAEEARSQVTAVCYVAININNDRKLRTFMSYTAEPRTYWMQYRPLHWSTFVMSEPREALFTRGSRDLLIDNDLTRISSWTMTELRFFYIHETMLETVSADSLRVKWNSYDMLGLLGF